MVEIDDDTEKITRKFRNLATKEEMEEYILACRRTDRPEMIFREKVESGKISKLTAFARCDGYLNISFFQKAMSGHVRNPKRDKMILMGIVFDLSPDEFRQMLEAYHLPPLYIRDLRDAVIMKCQQCGVRDIETINQDLSRHGLNTFEFCE